MSQRSSISETLLAYVVILHLILNAIHGLAHARVKVFLSFASTIFVLTVILIGPIAGLILQRAFHPRAGALVIAITLAGAFFFGVANHFLIHGADHVSQVAQPERALFGITAVSLAVTELFGATLAFWCATHSRRQS